MRKLVLAWSEYTNALAAFNAHQSVDNQKRMMDAYDELDRLFKMAEELSE